MPKSEPEPDSRQWPSFKALQKCIGKRIADFDYGPISENPDDPEPYEQHSAEDLLLSTL
jgi:hypothetical protein